ncbi:hypothetical protein [Cupriavidus sp. H39]|uniref:hypothetical protein n=1 Tax=Cupriavidus sp. H39 TaxID=3401635 RepID=UPI003D079CA9
MNTTQATTVHDLPSHVIAAVTQAAGLAARRLRREWGVQIGREALLSDGIEFAQQQARESGGRHPEPEHSEFFKSIMVDVLVERHTT